MNDNMIDDFGVMPETTAPRCKHKKEKAKCDKCKDAAYSAARRKRLAEEKALSPRPKNIHDFWVANRAACERDTPEAWAEMLDADRDIEDVRYWVSNYFGKREEWATGRFTESLPDLDIRAGELIFPGGVEADIVQQIDDLVKKYGEGSFPLVDSHYFGDMPGVESQEAVIHIHNAADFGRLAVDDTFRLYGLITRVPKGLKGFFNRMIESVRQGSRPRSSMTFVNCGTCNAASHSMSERLAAQYTPSNPFICFNCAARKARGVEMTKQILREPHALDNYGRPRLSGEDQR
jgi:hypothetical protein